MLTKRHKNKILKTIRRNEYSEVLDIIKTKVYKNKKKYTRKSKHKSNN